MIIPPQIRTTPKIRAEIQALTHFSQSELAQKSSVTEQTSVSGKTENKPPIRVIALNIYRPRYQKLKKLSL